MFDRRKRSLSRRLLAAAKLNKPIFGGFLDKFRLLRGRWSENHQNQYEGAQFTKNLSGELCKAQYEYANTIFKYC